MNGMLNIVMVIATIFVALMTYQVKFKARTLELDIHVLDKNSQQLKNDISVLRAEKAYLSRPERIERLARKFLKLSPTVPKRSISYDVLQAQRLDVESERSALLVLEAMKQKDKERSKHQKTGVDSDVALSEKMSKILVPENGQNKVSDNRAQPEPHKAQVMGSIQRKETQPEQPLNRDRKEIESTTVMAEERKKRARPVKPKWTYYGGIGDDD